MNKITTIWKKELRDTIRDRRTLMAMIVMPMLLMPLIIVGIGKFTEYQIRQAEEKVLDIAIENQAAAPEFSTLLEGNEKQRIVEPDMDLRQAVKDNEIAAALVIPEDFADKIAADQPVKISVLRNSINTDSSTVLNRLTGIISQYNNQVLAAKFQAAGIQQDILNGVTIVPEDVATKEEVGGFGLGFLLPLFIIMWSVVGGQYVAVDCSAGEKERKTLESLLLSPVRRIDIVFGKFLAVATTALISVIVALSSLYFAITAFGFGDLMQGGSTNGSVAADSTLQFSIDPMALLILFGVSILLVIMFSAIQLSIAIFAKSYKEAQSYIGPSYLIIILPTVIVNTLPDFRPAMRFFAIPVVNAILLFKEVLIGEYNLGHIVITVISLVIYAIVAILVATKIYSKEGVLFRD